MAALTRVAGPARVVSRVARLPDRGDAARASNDIRISKLGLTLYRLFEEYDLDPDGAGVAVRARGRFGPVPWPFSPLPPYRAEIRDGGMEAVYRVPLLGAWWVGCYTVAPDRNHVRSVLTCDWAEARQTLTRVSSSP